MQPDSGSVIIGGREVTKCSSRERTSLRRKQLGFIFQSHNLLPYLKTADQLSLVQEKQFKSSISIEELLAELEIVDCRNKFPREMSGGEKQRAAIARAFVNDPDVFLADEPTASLDAERGRVAAHMIRDAVRKHNKAAIMVTHDTRILDLTDTVYRLDNCGLTRDKKSSQVQRLGS